MEDDNLTYFEKLIQRELEDVERRIEELNAERLALSRQLAKARAERTGLQFATRKNSMNRVLAENAIITALRENDRPMRTAELYRQAQLTNFDLKENTFRTYLNRMKKRGLIKPSRIVGQWILAENHKGCPAPLPRG